MSSLLDSLSRSRERLLSSPGPRRAWWSRSLPARPRQGPTSRSARRVENLEETKAQVEALGRRCVPVRADVSKPEDYERVVELTVAQLGKVDALINNAGTGGPTDATCHWVTVTQSSPARALGIGHRCQELTSAGGFPFQWTGPLWIPRTFAINSQEESARRHRTPAFALGEDSVRALAFNGIKARGRLGAHSSFGDIPIAGDQSFERGQQGLGGRAAEATLHRQSGVLARRGAGLAFGDKRVSPDDRFHHRPNETGGLLCGAGTG